MKKKEIIKRIDAELKDDTDYLVTFEFGFGLNRIEIDSCEEGDEK